MRNVNRIKYFYKIHNNYNTVNVSNTNQRSLKFE